MREPVSDYRDDRPALRQRIDALQAELKQARVRADRADQAERRASELEREVLALQGKLEALSPRPAQTPERSQWVMFAAFGTGMLALVGGWLVVSMRSTAPVERQIRVPPVTRADDSPPTPKPRPAPPPMEVSPSCQCGDDATDRVALAYRVGATMRMGGQATYMLSYALHRLGVAGERKETADGGAEPGLAAFPLVTGVQTVPPGRLEGGDVTLLLQCLPGRMVLAFEQRVSAWSLQKGDPLWSATLPAPVGSARNGPLRIACERLPEPPGEIVVIPHAAGKTRLNIDDGSQVGG